MYAFPGARVHTKEDDLVYAAAAQYIEAGFSLIPIASDGTKDPAFELLPREWSNERGKYVAAWASFKQQAPTPLEVRRWYYEGIGYGIGIVAGAVSGHLEIIDLDNWSVVEPWMQAVRDRAPSLLDRLVQVRTPRPGLHGYYRCSVIEPSQKLARVPDPEKNNEKPKTLIETKGEGGYCVAPPSPGACHKTGRPYTYFTERTLTDVQTITAEERVILLDCARAQNIWTEPARPQYVPRANATGGVALNRPGDDFAQKTDWGDILQPHGWTWVSRAGSVDYWRRPGKGKGTSATTNHADSDLLYMFTSNGDPFEEGKAYSKFTAYALLNHKGDFQEAARALSRKGFGACGRRHGACPRPFSRYAALARRQNRPR